MDVAVSGAERRERKAESPCPRLCDVMTEKFIEPGGGESPDRTIARRRSETRLPFGKYFSACGCLYPESFVKSFSLFPDLYSYYRSSPFFSSDSLPPAHPPGERVISSSVLDSHPSPPRSRPPISLCVVVVRAFRQSTPLSHHPRVLRAIFSRAFRCLSPRSRPVYDKGYPDRSEEKGYFETTLIKIEVIARSAFELIHSVRMNNLNSRQVINSSFCRTSEVLGVKLCPHRLHRTRRRARGQRATFLFVQWLRFVIVSAVWQRNCSKSVTGKVSICEYIWRPFSRRNWISKILDCRYRLSYTLSLWSQRPTLSLSS